MKALHTLFERPEDYNPNVHGAFSASASSPFAEKKRQLINQREEIMRKVREKRKARLAAQAKTK